ncbi:MAG TPA: hypothetical protein VNF48_01115 [Gammaproteobacteria bacterium]|nr:hypothetical protein [Gammaproteobacteria bacterium]
MKSLIQLVVLLTIVLGGCANPYVKFYQSNLGGRPASTLPSYMPCDGPPIIYSSSNAKADVLELERQGYNPIGYSSFEGAAKYITKDNILAEANALGACKVLAVSQYSRTVSGAMPLTVPNNSTSYSSGTATAYGSGGYATAYGSGTTTTYGTQTVMMPYSVERFNAGAIYFFKYASITGTISLPVPPEISKIIGHNGGLLVKVVVRDGPAYKADIMEGDVLWSFGGKEVDEQNIMPVLFPLQGQSVSVDIYRGATLLHKKMTLNTLPHPELVPPQQQ